MSATTAPPRQRQQADAEGMVRSRSPWSLAAYRLRQDGAAVIALATVCALVLMAVMAPLVAHLTGHGPNEQFPATGLTPEGLPCPPGGEFWLGTDSLGRDVLVRAFYGARVSLEVGITASISAVLIGTAVGLVAGYARGKVDAVLARLTDTILSFPDLLAAIAITAVVGPGEWVVISVIALLSWGGVARIVRGQVISVRQREYVEAAQAVGAKSGRIMLAEVLPNIVSPLLVVTTLRVPSAIVVEASLSFLGVGILPPTPTWGTMLADAVEYYQVAWWFLAAPGFLLMAATLAFNTLGDSLRDALDPRGTAKPRPRRKGSR
jgi:peptide/nickel transport system permease protein